MNKLHIIPALKDNYIWLFTTSKQHVIIVDPGEALPVIDYLNQYQLQPVAILLTHHHRDHTAGVPELQKQYPSIEVFGPDEIDLPITKISNMTELVIDNNHFDIITVPGHTLGHVAYYCKPYLFCGDTLFSAGCGRIFEGTSQQMLTSLNKLKILADSTIACPAHEYTLSNLKFAHHFAPEDKIINQAYQQAKTQTITLPTTIAKERKINLFLRCNEADIQQKFNVSNELELFTFFRSQKDNF